MLTIPESIINNFDSPEVKSLLESAENICLNARFVLMTPLITFINRLYAISVEKIPVLFVQKLIKEWFC